MATTAAAGGGEEEEGHMNDMMDSECTPLHNLELAFIFWGKDQQDWIWHQAASTKKAQVGPQSKCKGPKPRHKCARPRVRSQLMCMQVKWHASANSREKIIDTLKIERFQHDVDWAMLNKLQQKQRTSSKTKGKKQV